MFYFPELFFSQTKHKKKKKNSILFHIYTHGHVTERERSGPGTHGRWGGGAVVAAIYRRRRENERRACSPILSPFFQRFLKIRERERERGGGDRVKNQLLKYGRETDPSLPWNNITLLSSFSFLSEFSF